MKRRRHSLSELPTVRIAMVNGRMPRRTLRDDTDGTNGRRPTLAVGKSHGVMLTHEATHGHAL